MESFITHSSTETTQFGYEWGKNLPNHALICFFGDLAAGKTTLIKGIASGASGCSEDSVNSPTFVYLNIYSGKRNVYHFDLYRLQNPEEFLSMGFDEYFDVEGIVCIEWPERIAPFLPVPRYEVRLQHAGEGSRVIEINEVK